MQYFKYNQCLNGMRIFHQARGRGEKLGKRIYMSVLYYNM
jgi:hypothetical protein